MKYLVSIFLLTFIILFATNTHAAETPNFPTRIGEYKLVTEQPHIISYEPKECFTFSNDISFCQDYWTASYKSTEDNIVYVYLSNISSGFDIKKSQTAATKKNISSNGVYLNSENKVEWFINNGKVSSYKFNHIIISQAKIIDIGDGSYTYDYWSTSPANTSVYKYFSENFPPTPIVADSVLVNKINNPDTNISLAFKNIKELQTFIAGKDYKILLDTYNIASDVKIYFDISYIDNANGKLTTSSVQISKNKKGEYIWKIPKHLAYGDKNSINNYIYRIRASVIGLNGKILYETETPKFRIISNGNKKTNIAFTEFPDNAVYIKGNPIDIKWINNAHIDRYEINLIFKKGNKNLGSIYDSFATNDFPASFNWIPYSSLKNGKYYFHIKGYLNGKNVSEGKTPIFEIK